MLSALLLSMAFYAAATNIYMSAYGGVLYSLDYNRQQETLTLTDMNTGCAPSPAWVDLDREERVLYCLDEGILRANGSVSSYQVSQDGYFTIGERRLFPSGPSAGVIYGPLRERTLAVSHYNGSAISLWDINSQGLLNEQEELFFYQSTVGPNPRQTAPHVHDIILDPTGNFLIGTAHGEDELFLFSINHKTNNLTQLPSIAVAPGSGPRHGVFWSPNGMGKTTNLYFFLLAEITSALTTYSVTYGNGSINLVEVAVTNSYGGGAVPDGNGPAEIIVSPDNNFIVLTNRNNTMVHASPFFDNIIEEYWDNLASFVPHANGSLMLQEIVPCGGSYPRNIAFNAAGDRLAVANSGYNRMVIFERNITSGLFGPIVANYTVPGLPTSVVWDD